MTLKLVPPGRRKRNRYWLVYGRYGGRVREVSTKTTEEAAAKRFLREYERELEQLDERVARARAAPSALDRERLELVRAGFDLVPPLTSRAPGNLVVLAAERRRRRAKGR